MAVLALPAVRLPLGRERRMGQEWAEGYLGDHTLAEPIRRRQPCAHPNKASPAQAARALGTSRQPTGPVRDGHPGLESALLPEFAPAASSVDPNPPSSPEADRFDPPEAGSSGAFSMHLVLPSHSTDGGGGGGVGLGVVEPVDVNTNTNISTNMRFVNMSGYGRKFPL
jgi:hypothetical protein